MFAVEQDERIAGAPERDAAKAAHEGMLTACDALG